MVVESNQKKSPKQTDDRQSLVNHLEELRNRILTSVVAIVVAAGLSFAWAGKIIELLKGLGGKSLPQLAFFSPPEAVLAYMKVALSAGLILCMPILLYQVWSFIRPGLTSREQRFGLAFVWWGTFLFLVGAAFAYWILLPVSLSFLLGFAEGTLTPVISINRYLSFTTAIILACGGVFQLPLIVYLLTKMGLLTPQWLRKQWRMAVMSMVVAAAIITPTTDAATMLLMTLPMLLLYEISIWISAAASRKKEKVS